MNIGDEVINTSWKKSPNGFIEGINGEVACVTWADPNAPNFVGVECLKVIKESNMPLCNHKEYDHTCQHCITSRLYGENRPQSFEKYIQDKVTATELRLAELERSVKEQQEALSDFMASAILAKNKVYKKLGELAAQKEKDRPCEHSLTGNGLGKTWCMKCDFVHDTTPQKEKDCPSDCVCKCAKTPHIVTENSYEHGILVGRKEERERLKEKFQELRTGLFSITQHQRFEMVNKCLFDEVNND